ncbi:hypothetical protein Patl1_36343 [Pistacia atlantica]|nr:hypothetical protein Patl1_36343 [Pistacia atlantica]
MLSLIVGRERSPILNSRFPLYYHVKFAFLVWLQLPPGNGARHMYMSHLRPFLLRHQARLDQIVNFIYRQMSNFVSAHQPEFQFVGAVFMEIMSLGRGNRAIEGPTAQILDPHPDQGTERLTAQIPDPQPNDED